MRFLIGEAMNRSEFVQNAVKRGYSTKRAAEEYAKGRDEFTQSDLIAVYAIQTDDQFRDKTWTHLGDGNYKRKAIFYD